MKRSTKKLSKDDFIATARKVHGDKYDYSKVNYINNRTKVCIICPIHGDFWQAPKDHMRGQGCKYCSKKYKKDTDTFIKEAIKVHGDKFQYDKVVYKHTMEKVIITCPIHGDFLQTPAKHLSGQGCPNCRKNKKDDTESFIKKARDVHKDRYDYSKTNYLSNGSKVTIICAKHGEFLQTPNDHLDGCGCPKCKSSKLENTVRDFLKTMNIEFEEQKTWEWLLHNGNHQYVDFYLPDYNAVIECQGLQHFESVEFFNKNKSLDLIKQMDFNKKSLCNDNGIILYYFSNLKLNNYPYEVFEDLNNLINKIMGRSD